MKRHLIFLIIALSFGFTQAQTPDPDCPETLVPRMITGVQGRVLPGDANRLRAEPTTTGASIGRIPGDAIFDVLAGPVCADGYNWWQVDYNGQIGWTVEADDAAYWLQPLITTEDMEFSMDFGTLALGIDGMLIEQSILTTAPELSTPAFLYTTLAGWDAPTGSNRDASLSIYPVAAYADLGDYPAATLQALQEILKSGELPEDPDDLPFLPNIMAAQMFRARIELLDFENGRGLRYITQFAQDVSPIHNAGTLYIFLGLTDDNRFFISAQLPISADFLPESFADADFDVEPEDYMDYLDGVVTELERIPPDAFAPDLDAIDAMFESLTFTLNDEENRNAD